METCHAMDDVIYRPPLNKLKICHTTGRQFQPIGFAFSYQIELLIFQFTFQIVLKIQNYLISFMVSA